MMKTILKSFFEKFEKYLFSYKDGYFEMPYLGNTPETFVKVMSKMPFIKHDKVNQTLKVNNPFCKGLLYYSYVEDEIFLTITEIKYKQKVSFKIIYDKNITSDYYVISFIQSKNKFENKQSIFNGIEYSNNTWSIAKPYGLQRSYHEANSHNIYVSFYIKKSWLDNNCTHQVFHQFNSSAEDFVLFSDILTNLNDAYISLLYQLKSPTIETLALKESSYRFINTFFEKLNNNFNNKLILNYKDQTLYKIMQAEKILIENIFIGFPGIEIISQRVGMSPTHIKSNFKIYFGQTLYEYFKSKQMFFAKEALSLNNKTISEIATQLGYANYSKFSMAFRKYNGMLPSEYQNSTI